MSSSKETVLKSEFLAGLTEEERRRVFTRSGMLSALLGKWVADYPGIMRPVRVPQLSLTLAAAAARLEGPSDDEVARRLLPAACLSMWLFSVDDTLDESIEPAAAMWPRFEQYLSLFGENPDVGTGGEPLLAALRDIREQLRGDEGTPRSCFDALRPHLRESLAKVRDGMRYEDDWSSQRQSAPSFEEYLDKAGRHSIGVMPVYLCILITLGDDSLQPHLGRLLTLGDQASICIRLANDLRSYERESAEGKLNSIGLRQRELMQRDGVDAQKALEQARAAVKERMSRALETFLVPGAGESTGVRHLERLCNDLVAFACNFYSHHDYHHALKTQDGHDLDARTSSPRS